MVETSSNAIPLSGENPDDILRQIKKLKEQDVPWKEGKVWSLIYYADEEHDNLLKDAHNELFSTNYLNPLAFKSLHKMEQEVVRMTADMLHGDDQTVGVMTTGGTESILLAMFCYRQRARKLFPNIVRPEVVAPMTIHPAFEKAALMFGLRLRKAPVDNDRVVIPAAMEQLITKNTILILASAPAYPNGVLDPIEAISEIAIRHKLPFHVDGCIGGFMLPWVEKLGYNVPLWDYRVKGVCSVSADVHKFGYGAKGASVLTYRNMDYMRYQFVVTTEYPGGIYISPTVMGTRAGGPIAAAWAGMKHLGQEGYLSLAKKVMEGAEQFRAGLADIPEVIIVGKPVMNIISYTTKNNDPDIFVIGDQLEEMGWMVDRQQLPDSIHLTITPTNVVVMDQYLTDLKEAVAYAKEHRGASAKGNAALYGLMARIPFRGIVEKSVMKIMEEMYGAGKNISEDDQEEKVNALSGQPKWMGRVNRVLMIFNKWKKILGKK